MHAQHVQPLLLHRLENLVHLGLVVLSMVVFLCTRFDPSPHGDLVQQKLHVKAQLAFFVLRQQLGQVPWEALLLVLPGESWFVISLWYAVPNLLYVLVLVRVLHVLVLLPVGRPALVQLKGHVCRLVRKLQLLNFNASSKGQAVEERVQVVDDVWGHHGYVGEVPHLYSTACGVPSRSSPCLSSCNGRHHSILRRFGEKLHGGLFIQEKVFPASFKRFFIECLQLLHPSCHFV